MSSPLLRHPSLLLSMLPRPLMIFPLPLAAGAPVILNHIANSACCKAKDDSRGRGDNIRGGTDGLFHKFANKANSSISSSFFSSLPLSSSHPNAGSLRAMGRFYRVFSTSTSGASTSSPSDQGESSGETHEEKGPAPRLPRTRSVYLGSEAPLPSSVPYPEAEEAAVACGVNANKESPGVQDSGSKSGLCRPPKRSYDAPLDPYDLRLRNADSHWSDEWGNVESRSMHAVKTSGGKVADIMSHGPAAAEVLGSDPSVRMVYQQSPSPDSEDVGQVNNTTESGASQVSREYEAASLRTLRSRHEGDDSGGDSDRGRGIGSEGHQTQSQTRDDSTSRQWAEEMAGDGLSETVKGGVKKLSEHFTKAFGDTPNSREDMKNR
uniref:Uncharacterized protein n=1 Tax=Polytomella parva TaxID=51329 RepID=A0A7S0VAX8_9CHLO|mmetsp:Transcript_34515/g.62192  ORF Transcript_34515/g.62192 Transcript_34515/m.62192 type:complete len:378 (+) Transcript_34515:41-1174(+)